MNMMQRFGLLVTLLGVFCLAVVVQAAEAGMGAGDALMTVLLANTPMAVSQARVINPVLTTYARGYMNMAYAWPYLFPVVNVLQRGGKILEFGREAFVKRAYGRAPATARQRINVAYSDKNYAVVQTAVDGIVPFEQLQDANQVPGISLGRLATRASMESAALQVELEAARLATSDDTYDATNIVSLQGNAKWSSANSTPAVEVETRKKQIKDGIGLEPNTLVVGHDVHRKLRNNEAVIDRIKYNATLGKDHEAKVNPVTLAEYFNVDNYVVGMATYLENEDDKVFKDAWGNFATLAYTAASTLGQAEGGMGEPSFGYNYRLDGYPEVREPRQDLDRDCWVYANTLEETPEVVGKVAGLLFKDVV